MSRRRTSPNESAQSIWVSRYRHLAVIDVGHGIGVEGQMAFFLLLGRDHLAVVARDVGGGEVARECDAVVQVFDLMHPVVLGDTHDMRVPLALLVVAKDDRHMPL